LTVLTAMVMEQIRRGLHHLIAVLMMRDLLSLWFSGGRWCVDGYLENR
jgi:hypothetical protein